MNLASPLPDVAARLVVSLPAVYPAPPETMWALLAMLQEGGWSGAQLQVIAQEVLTVAASTPGGCPYCCRTVAGAHTPYCPLTALLPPVQEPLPESEEEALLRQAREAVTRSLSGPRRWTRADWTHYDSRGRICEGDSPECATCEEATADADAAEVDAEEALRLLGSPRLSGRDAEEALSRIDRAAAREHYWGDDPTYGPAARAVRRWFASIAH